MQASAPSAFPAAVPAAPAAAPSWARWRRASERQRSAFPFRPLRAAHEIIPKKLDDIIISSSSLQHLHVGDDVLAILGIGNADDHFGPVYISRGIGEIFVELLLVPCDASGFEGGGIVVARRGTALASEYARERWAE